MVLLEIAQEIKRVCDENDIQYFLDSGTLIGAVRHQGFIPWDDDLDIGMLRNDYQKFIRIAPKVLNPRYYLQTWDNDYGYPLPFAKVRKKGTVYIEEKSNQFMNNGFYVDIFPLDYQPDDQTEQKELSNKIVNLERQLLMKCHARPWYEHGKLDYKKRFAYIYYQLISAASSKDVLIKKYNRILKEVGITNTLMLQTGHRTKCAFNKNWFRSSIFLPFEGINFSVPVGYKERLTAEYGDYMKLPPVEERENRHDIVQIKFGING